MTPQRPYQPVAYDDPSTAHEMTADCRAVEAALRLPERRTAAERAAKAAARPAPSIRFEDYPREVRKREIAVSDAAARLAAALHLHLD
ncbi:MAG: hypothetical protein ACXVW2_15935 [Nocardioidaceae bacterium]